MTVVHASPTKEFFVNMITRDISLTDSILDLADNSIDAAIKTYRQANKKKKNTSLEGYFANIRLDKNEFSIEDNCGGIPIDIAVNYAFHFGRRPGSHLDVNYGIGVYGIGMKRAVFKLGQDIEVRSNTGVEAFKINIEVANWMRSESDWDFELHELSARKKKIGTKIVIRKLHKSISREFRDGDFENFLRGTMARDYSFIIDAGFKIRVNGKTVKPYEFKLRSGHGFSPAKVCYDDDGVQVEILAGMASPPPDDISPEREKLKEIDYFGWFVACNNRIVLAGDKSDKTVWGDDDFTRWHSQYRGFMGIVKFRSEKASKLPWTTTKRDVDQSSGIYRRAVSRMKVLTRKYIAYTSARRQDLGRAGEAEKASVLIPLKEVKARRNLGVPLIVKSSPNTITSIQYKVDRSRLARVKKALSRGYLSNSEAGKKTFDYFYENEVEE